MKRLTFNSAMEQFPRIETDPDMDVLPEDLMPDGPMPWDDEEAEDMG